MKGLIDLRVADMLAKQSAMHHKASMQQSLIAQREADKAAFYTARAEGKETSWTPSLGGEEYVLPIRRVPHSSTWYQPGATATIYKGKYLASAREPVPPTLPALGGLGKMISIRSFSLPTLTSQEIPRHSQINFANFI